MTRFRSAGAFALHVVALGFLLVSAARGFQPSVASAGADWPMHGGPDNIRYSPLTQINRDNVSSLRVVWTYDSHDAFKGSEMQSNPVVVDGMLYATTPTLKVIALDAATGREIWKFDPGGGAGTGGRFRHRGVTVHRDRVFVLNGHEYVVIACGGGKNGAPSGSTIVAFALP